MSATTQTSKATEKQIAYIAELVYQNGKTYRDLARNGLKTQGQREAAALLAALWDHVQLPTERLTVQTASAVIDRLKPSNAWYLVPEEWLTNAKMARTYGVTEFIEANRASIEQALAQ